MKLHDTTDPTSVLGARTLFSENDLRNKIQLVENFHIHLIGMYSSSGGPEWSSGGRKESDFLHHIDLTVSGRRQVVHKGKTTELTPGWAWFLPGCLPVERRCQEQYKVYFLKFRCEWLPGVDPLLDWPERQPLRLGRWTEDTMLKNWRFGQGHDVKSLLLLQAQIQTWLANSLPNFDQIIFNHIRTHGRFEPVFDLIEEKLGADLRLDTMAAALRLPVSAFSMAFARSTGMSPKAYLNRRLNQEAIKLLIRSDALVKEVADQLRFSDEHYFSRFFKKLNGLPPALYRQKFFGAE
ncbi:MAG: helix-turn-helix transcriptional regulator [Akkermansiaceae bacterium]|nr:helix-turn-helix transcriptional regulator [Verrucomicrobiales bacterium]